MTRILEHLTRIDGDGSYQCVKCGHVLGIADDFRELSAQFDDSINALEPISVNTRSSAFVMRHHICPECGVLFEVEMIASGVEDR